MTTTTVVTRRTVMSGISATACLAGAGPALAASGSARAQSVRLIDMPVTIAASGARSRLVSGIMRDRVTVLNFMFLGCGSSCPQQSAILSRVQSILAGQMGRDVVFVSITMSPMTDTPSKLANYAENFLAGPGWHFVAGSFADTQRLREGFDATSGRIEDHPPVFAIGRADSVKWTTLFGAPRPAALKAAIDVWLR